MNNSEKSFRAPDAALAYLLLRLTLGMNFTMHGLARIFSGEGKFVGGEMQAYATSFLPQPLLLAFFNALPWIEATLGILILVGLFTRIALICGGLLITVLTFGIGLRQNWETAGQQLLYALVFAVMVAFVLWNRYSIDGMLRARSSSPE